MMSELKYCEVCGNKRRIRKGKINNNFMHINIGQNPSHHYFCSKECKLKWIYAIQRKAKK